jgi:hypothetical protein
VSVEAPIAIDLDRTVIEAYCRKWRINEFSLGIPPRASVVGDIREL